jgi:2-C-methyl-D-erythritol 4-phosphate cytidylyltransferase
MSGQRVSLALVVTAAGRGLRFDSPVPKQYVPVLGVPMLQRTLSALDQCPQVDALAVVVNAEDAEHCKAEIANRQIGKVVAVTAGGEERALSVRNGLQALGQVGTWDLVGVHDGARPLVTCDVVGRAVDALAADPDLDGVVTAVASIDTIKVVDDAGVVIETPDRRRLWRAQTPQIFRWQVLLAAYDQPPEVLLAATDDSYLVEQAGGRVKVVGGSPENLKITDRADLHQAENILAGRGH